MFKTMYVLVLQCVAGVDHTADREHGSIELVDLTHSTNWKDLSDYYGALEKHW